MADTNRKKRLDKTEPQKPAYQSSQKFYCCRCGIAYSRSKGFFPVSHSPMYRGSGYLPICSDCIETMYDTYRSQLGDREAMHRMCMKMDLYWNDSIYDMVEKTAGVNSRIKSYITKTNMIRYIDKTYDDTIKEESLRKPTTESQDDLSLDASVVEDGSTENEQEKEIPQDLVDFWGPGYSYDFYIELDRRYKDWTMNVREIQPNERALYKQICQLEAVISRDIAQGKSPDKNVNSLNALLGSMNLKPTQQKDDTDSAVENTPFGVWIRRWENERPIPEPDPELKDVDGIVRYIEVWFKGHLAKMLGIKNSYSKMYEDEITKLRVEHPEYEDEDDETLFNDIFDSQSGSDDD